MADEFQVSGKNSAALFKLKVHRGEGMALLAMDWKSGRPPRDFTGFAIEYREPGGDRFYALKNRLNFLRDDGRADPVARSTRLAPIQKFRWVHFPRNANLDGDFVYRVVPAFMNAAGELSYGEPQEAAIALRRETVPGKLNVAFTRGFVSSQAFVDRYESQGPINTLLPAQADEGLTFVPTHPAAAEALAWMGFEARDAVLALLDEAIADKNATVRVTAYDLNEPGVVSRLVKLKKRLRILIDDDGAHQPATSGESQAEALLVASAGRANVKRQHMGKLQHNKSIVVDGPNVRAALCGSTNYSWRGFFVQANNAVVVRGKNAIKPFADAFEHYWTLGPAAFGNSPSAEWNDLKLAGVRAKVAFSPHSPANALLGAVAADVANHVSSSLFYSLAFLYQTPGAMQDAIRACMLDADKFVYGISDKKVGGLEVQLPDGTIAPMRPAALGKNAPEPFKSEPTGGGGTRMHHKFVVIDFDKPTARVYFGSYNFSAAADNSNGENLMLVQDRRVATAYMIEALRIFDHYHFRVSQESAKQAGRTLCLKRPPPPGADPWWREDWTDARKIKDRTLFC